MGHTAFILYKKPIPKQVPALNAIVRLITQRSGFLAPKHGGKQGVRTPWQGLRETCIFVDGIFTLGVMWFT